MAGRRLSAEEAALWRRAIASVRPLAPTPPLVPEVAAVPSSASRAASPPPAATPVRHAKPVPPRAPAPGTTLDASWDRRLARGLVAPDSSIDLHGHTLDSAYHALDQALARAILRRDRLLLLVTGRPPRPESERPHARGRIRAAVGDWLAASRHAGSIAAVRAAHPRHGGAGALYLVLRRPKGTNC